MIATYRAFRYLGNMSTGRTQPLLLECEAVDDEGEIRTFFVKAPGAKEVGDYELFVETTAYLIARELSVETPLSAMIEIEKSFVDIVNPILEKSGFQKIKAGLGFGSERIIGGVPVTGEESLNAGQQREQAVAIFAFDLLVQNPDRIPRNPNCLMRQGRLIAFDFNSALSFLLLIGNPEEPWRLSQHQIHEKHLFYRALSGKDVDFSAFLNRVRGLSVERINEILEVVPFGSGKWDDKVRDHLVSVVENADDMGLELTRCVR